MAQRHSGYVRQENDWYPTPAWVVDALAEHISLAGLAVWEPAAGDGAMAKALMAHGASVRATDIIADEAPRQADRKASVDFLQTTVPLGGVDAIISNPPFGVGGRIAVDFASHALAFMRQRNSAVRLVAFLLTVDFDSASTRTALFRDCPEFALKIALLKRIKWFDSWGVFTLHGERIGRIDDATDEADAQRLAQERFPEQHFELRVSGPSTNHAWFVWQRPALNVPHGPVTRYAPTEPFEAPSVTTPALQLADL